MKNINIVLHCPEIPQNTGNIARTCAATGAALHIIKPMGFEIDDKKLKRAGLDYWHYMDLTYYDDLQDFFKKNPGEYFFFTTKGRTVYSNVNYPDNAYIFFGKETKGLPEDLLKDNYDKCIRIPMKQDFRSLNLSNAVAVVAFEAMRQLDFEDMEDVGHLTGRPEFAEF